jgi:Xaa-Pro aminopeptidase
MSASFSDRLARLRQRLAARGVDAFVLPRTDEHGSEYLPAASARVAWLTGFTGSAAQVVVLREKAAVFSDGRYTVQLAQEVDEELFERLHVTERPPAKWLAEHLPQRGRVGIDPFLMRRAEVERLAKTIAGKQGLIEHLAPNPVDEIWDDRPAMPAAPVSRLEERYAGESSAAKRERIGRNLEEAAAETLVVTAADAIAWLLNIRGQDIPYNPLCLSFLLLERDGTCRWFIDPQKIPPTLSLDNGVQPEPADHFLAALGGLAGRTVLADPAEVHLGFLERLEQAGARLLERANPIMLAKARKNPVEIEGAIGAQKRDGAAIVRFLAWLDAQAPGSVDELGAAERLNVERGRDPLFRGESFPTISAHGPNAALPHYRTSPESNRRLDHGGVYLVDSGGQYLDATTDITRTVALGAVPDEVRERFTLVLKGHIAIATAVFPKGTTGAQLDTLARLALWRHGLDFDHGTGHGIGAYLVVHEGPQRISKAAGGTALEPGMITSNEPGYYKSGDYGIRIENLVLTEARPTPPGGERELLGFRTLTLCPIDRRLVLPEFLSTTERDWLNGYHRQVRDELAPLLPDVARRWLEEACAPL